MTELRQRLLHTLVFWWRWRVARFQAWRWLRAGDDRLVADALYALNHLARARHSSRDLIYRLKTPVIQAFCEAGYLRTATLHVQTQPCWRCDGTGREPWNYRDGDEGQCVKCDGTGIYRQHKLVLFVFDVAGKTYRWHQPRVFVTWPVPLDWDGYGAEMVDGPNGNGYRALDDEQIVALYCCLLWQYLRRRGVHVALPYPSLGRAVWHELERAWFWSEARRRWRIWRWDARDALRRKLHLPVPDEDFPF